MSPNSLLNLANRLYEDSTLAARFRWNMNKQSGNLGGPDEHDRYLYC